MSTKTYHIKLNGKVYEVEIEEVQSGQAQVAATTQEQKKTTPVSGNGEEITAPMPGSMSNILVKENQVVKKGDVLAILEAMKMENEIMSPIDGTIVSVNTTKGATVESGALLCIIK